MGDATQENPSGSDTVNSLVSLQDRFNKIVYSMDSELVEAGKKIVALESKVRMAEYIDKTLGDCGRCGEYKHRPWRDDDHGYVCVCLVLWLWQKKRKANDMGELTCP